MGGKHIEQKKNRDIRRDILFKISLIYNEQTIQQYRRCHEPSMVGTDFIRHTIVFTIFFFLFQGLCLNKRLRHPNSSTATHPAI